MPRRRAPHPDDWFRSDAWDEPARKLFEEKLGRARSSRAQYLRIKGLTLVRTSDERRVRAGRELLHRVLDEHPSEVLEVTGALYALGDSYARSGDPAAAEQHLRACLAAEAGANVSHGTELRLAEVLVAAGAPADFDEAWELLDQGTRDGLLSSSDVWRIEVARARLLAAAGDTTGAAEYAGFALEALANDRPQFSRHPDVGLIKADRATVREMKRLAK
jgi:hypothetical protein